MFFLARWPILHRVVHRLMARGKPYALPDGSMQYPTCPIDRLVWGWLTSKPGFNEALEQGRADFADGRFTEWDPDRDEP